MSKTNILLPIETINRELDSRLILAVMLAAPNRTIFVGQHDVLFSAARYMKGGVCIGKHIFQQDFPWEKMERYRRVKDNGIRVVFLDEEGAIYRGQEADWIRTLAARLDASRLEADDIVCAWGDFQRDLYKQAAPHLGDRVRTTGHPRFDMCKPAFRHYWTDAVEDIRKRYAPFVLVNTNLSLPNPGPGPSYAFMELNGWDVRDPQRRIRHLEEYAHLNQILMSMLTLINSLSIKFPALKIVVRPHPTEDFDFYRTVFKGVGNVVVVHEGSVVPWLQACAAMVHDGCTTGLEGHLSGIPVINLKVVENAQFDTYLPNVVGVRCTTTEEAVAAVETALRGRLGDVRPIPERARRLFGNFELDSFAETFGLIDRCLAEIDPTSSRFDERGFTLSEMRRRALQFGKDLARPYIPQRFRRQFSGPRWAKTFSQMFYGFGRNDLERRVARAQTVCRRVVTMRFVHRELFTIDAV